MGPPLGSSYELRANCPAGSLPPDVPLESKKAVRKSLGSASRKGDVQARSAKPHQALLCRGLTGLGVSI